VLVSGTEKSQSRDTLQGSGRNVMPVIQAFEVDHSSSLICPFHCGSQVRAARGYIQHAAAGGIEVTITLAGARMENFDSLHLFRFGES
jgi:hypothetical protein